MVVAINNDWDERWDGCNVTMHVTMDHGCGYQLIIHSQCSCWPGVWYYELDQFSTSVSVPFRTLLCLTSLLSFPFLSFALLCFACSERLPEGMMTTRGKGRLRLRLEQSQSITFLSALCIFILLSSVDTTKTFDSHGCDVSANEFYCKNTNSKWSQCVCSRWSSHS